MADEREMDKKEKAKKGTEPTTTGSQRGMGGSEGLGGSYVQGAGSGSGMSSVSSGYENMPEKGGGDATGSRARRSGETTDSGR